MSAYLGGLPVPRCQSTRHEGTSIEGHLSKPLHKYRPSRTTTRFSAGPTHAGMSPWRVKWCMPGLNATERHRRARLPACSRTARTLTPRNKVHRGYPIHAQVSLRPSHYLFSRCPRPEKERLRRVSFANVPQSSLHI